MLDNVVCKFFVIIITNIKYTISPNKMFIVPPASTIAILFGMLALVKDPGFL